MSLEGAKLICLNADDNGQFETISANGRTFKFGYYMDCDVVLEHPDAMGLQCIINCDAFGRVTIENRCSDQPITLDGKTLLKLRPLLHNTEICILDKKYLWQFDGNPQPKGFQMEDINDFTTPSKQTKNAQQPPNSEPARKWRRPLQTRLTIHSFAYCIKAGESPKDVQTTTDENKPLNIKKIIDADTVPNKRLSSSPPPTENISDFIDLLNTPKIGQSSFNRRDQPLSCCKLSETVITSYSPRETGIRQEKSFAVVQSPLTTSNVKIANDVSLGPFHHIVSPRTIQNCRPSMHLIDLITPKKFIPPTSSPSRTLLKSTLQKNLQPTKKKSPETPQKLKKTIDLSTPKSSDTVYSVRSTDDESVIILSDDCSGSSPSPVAKTPPRARTPQSLMKRVILNSAKKVAVNKKLLNLSESKSTLTPPSKNAAAVRFQSQSTPQRKSLGRFPSSAESTSAGKPRRNLVTSTPFRQRTDVVSSSSSRRSLLINSQSCPKKESRNSLMLKQALSLTPLTTSTTQNRKSVSCLKSQNKPRKSVSFLQNVEKDAQTDIDKVEKTEDEKAEVDQLNNTFTIEDNIKNDIELDKAASCHSKNDTFSPEKEKFQEEVREPSKCVSQSKVSLSSEKLDSQKLSKTPESAVITSSPEKSTGSVLLHSVAKHKHQASVDTKVELIHALSIVSQVEIISDNQKQLDTEFQDELIENQNSDPQSKINESVIEKHSQSIREDTSYDFDGVDEIFKTPKAKNVMILSSPKSISLQKPASDSVELFHSTEFDLSANLDDLFQTPQSEFITRRLATTTPATAAPIESLSPEEAFDMLVGRPILKKSYARKTPPKKQELSPLKTSNDPTLPKTDIEEWIDSVNELLDDPQDEDEMSFLTATMEDISRDPLMSQSVTGSANANRRFKVLNTPRDEYEMTINEENEEAAENKINRTALKDPLEATVLRSLSPNISGIGLLDHTSESIFSETLAISDESSLKETEKTMKLSDDHDKTALANNQKQLNVSQEDKARREIEEAFKNFENQRKALDEKRLASTPEAKKSSLSKIANRRTMGTLVPSDPTFDLKAIKAMQTKQRLNPEGFGKSLSEPINFENAKEETRISGLKSHLDLQKSERETSLGKSLLLKERNQESKMTEEFAANKEVPEFLENSLIKNSKPQKIVSKLHYQQQLAPEIIKASPSCQVEREKELAFENFEEESEFSEQRVAKTPEPMKVILKDHRRTLGTALTSEVKPDLQAAKNEREMELAFENFEEEPEFSEQREVKTPEPTKAILKDHRRTLGSALIPEVKLDLQAAKAKRELELAFENFEEEPEFSEQRVAKTPEPTKITLKDHRRTLGSALIPEEKLDLQAAKTDREMELAFENFEEEPEFSEQRVAKTPEPTKVTLKDHRRTLGSALISEVKLDLQAAKTEREMELAFENFEEEPEFSEQRVAKTPEPMKVALKDHRRTLGSALIPEVKLDLQAAKAERELELAFENFEEEPEFSELRVVKTPEPRKVTLKDHRRTLGSALISEVKLDLQTAKTEREMELAFENFEEEPEFSEQRLAKTPEPMKVALKDHRRTLGSALIPEVKLDLQAAKKKREMELAFENFEEEPEFSEQRVVKTPEPTKATLKDHRRTLGSALIPEVKLDLQAAKAERELELAFENFEEDPEFSDQRLAKTPEPMKIALKDHRRTLGSALMPEVRFDLQAAKAEREMELAFENFEEKPEFSEQRVVKTPELTKTTLKDHRRTLGSALIPEVKLDLQAAKAERELELAFENFEEDPEFSEQRVAKTPEPMRVALKGNRRTLGSALIPQVTIDLQAAKAERELELAFENFEEDPEFSDQRLAKTPELMKIALKDHRRTLGSALMPEVRLDLQAAKAEREMELAFENFEEKPEFSEQRVVKTPQPTKTTLKDHRRTLGSALIPEVKLDLQTAKAERELELAFENFEEDPEFSEQRLAKTPEPMKIALKDHRRTLGSALMPEVRLDLQAAKAEREMELAFENFEEKPEFSEQRVVKTPEPTKTNLKDHRRTLGSALMPEVRLDLQAAKAEREMELAFENFEEKPEFSEQRVVKTPEPTKTNLKDHRRTLGSTLIPEVKLDLQAAKAERELELAFENFEEEPEFSEQRLAKTPEPMKIALKDHRRTLGSALIPEVKLDLQTAKAERELELAFENFEEDPEFSEQRVAKTPEPMRVAFKGHRRTLGSALIPQVKLDLQAAKAERELELAFENFEEDPEFSDQRLAKTPEPMKIALKEHRRTLGSALMPEVRLDLQAAKAEREMELAFENFEEKPEFSEQRVVKTPELTKTTLKDHRRTLGSALIPEVKLDLQAAKAERELELAFENFEEDPEFSDQRLAKTPEPMKIALKDHRRTLGSALMPEVRLDLQAAKAEREMELAFENFEEKPEFSEQRVVKTPEPTKTNLKDHRRTLGSALIPEVKLDLQAAKAERELELAFENFEEDPEFSDQRLAKTPEPMKIALKDHRRTLGSALMPEVRLDLQAAKAERELELAFENFEEKPEFSEQRVVKTPELTKTTLKDHRRTLGSALIPEVKLDLQAAKAERDLKLDKTNIKNMTLEAETVEYAKLKCTELQRNFDHDEENQYSIDENIIHTSFVHTIEESASNLLAKSIDDVTAIEKINESITHQKGLPKKEIDFKIVKKENEEQTNQKVDSDFTTENIQSNEEVHSENLFKSEPQNDKSTTVRSLRIRPVPTEEDDQSKLNPFAVVNNKGVENINAPAPRRTRKKTVESLDDLKSSAGEDANMAQSKPQMRRTRQNSIDSFTDDKKTTRPSRKELQTSSSEDVPIKTTTVGIDSTDVDSTEDESNPTSKTSRKKRIRKIVSKTTETPLNETELHHILEPIDEEEIKSESKITNQDIEAKSLIILRDDADEITSLSPMAARSRIRGRKAQLNVVLIESNESNHFVSDKESTNEVDSVNKYIEIQEDGNSKEDCTEKIDVTNDADESIPSTPLPLTSRSRRPSKTKVPSNLLVPGLRRTRKGSVQQDTEVQTVGQVEIEVKRNIESLESNVLKDDNKPDDYDVQVTEADEDIVPSTPVKTKSRRRQVSNKQKKSPENSTKTSAIMEQVDLEKNVDKYGTSASLPLRTRGRKAILKQEIVSATTEEIIPDNQIISVVKDADDKETLQSTSVSLKSQEQKTESESVIFEGSRTKSPTVCDEKIISPKQLDSKTKGSIMNLESVPTQVENPDPASPVLSKTRGRRAAVKGNLDSESATPKGRVGRLKGVKKTNFLTESSDLAAAEKVVETPSSDKIEVSTSTELKNETPAVIQNSTSQIKSPIQVEKPIPSSPVLSKTRGRRAAVKANLDSESATPGGRTERPKGAKKTDLGTESKNVAAARKKNSQDDDRIEKVVETLSSNNTKTSTSSELKNETSAAILNSTQQIKSPIQVEEPVSTSPVLSKTRGRRAVVKPNLDSESAKTEGRTGRPKGAKKTDLETESSDVAAARENDSRDDDRIEKVVETSSSDNTKISTSPELKNETPSGIQNSIPEIRLIERSKANQKTNLGSKGTDETPSGEDNSKNDEQISKVVDDPSLEVPADIQVNITSKTRGRRAALKPEILENEFPAVRRARKRAGEQITETQQSQKTQNQEEEIKLNIHDCQLDSKSQDENVVHAVDSEQLITSVPLKKRGRKAAIKIEPAVPRAVIGTPKTVLTTDCTDEIQIGQDNPNDEESIAKVVVLSPDVFKSREIKNGNEGLVDVVENNLTSKTTRGRRAVMKPVNVPSGKSGRKRANEQTIEYQSLQENENEVTKVKGCQIDAKNQAENDKPTAVVEQPMTPVPKKRGRKAAVKTELAISTPATETTVRSAGRENDAEKLGSPADGVKEVDGTEEVPINLPSSKICETIDLIPTRSITESSTPVRRGGRRNVAGKPVDVQNSPPESEKITTEFHEKQDESANLSKTKQNKVLLTLESSTPIRRGGRGRGLRTNFENAATESNVELPKSRGRKANLKVEVVDSSNKIEHVIEIVSDEDKSASHTKPNPIKSEPLSAENSSLVQQTRQKRYALQRITAEKDSDKTAVKQETTEALNESSTTDGDIDEHFSAKKRTRRAPVKLTEFIVSNLVQQIKPEILDSRSESSDTEIQNPTVPKKRGRPPTAKLQNVESTQDSTSAGKRGRKAIVKDDDDDIESAPSRRGGRQGKSKDEAAVTLIKNSQKDDNKNDESCVLVSDEGKPDESSQRKQTRRGKAISEATSPVSEEQQIQIEVITENKPTRGRGKALLKNNSTLESTHSHTEEEQSASSTKPKSNRGRKAATKTDPENKITHEKTSEPELSSSTKLETSQDEDKEKIVTKPRRGRKAVKAEPAFNSPVTSKPSPVTKKTTRGRKAAVKNVTIESDDAQTRSDKQQDNDTQPTSKRRNLEILINDDQQDTPSKRARRKPNKLLSDEFIT